MGECIVNVSCIQVYDYIAYSNNKVVTALSECFVQFTRSLRVNIGNHHHISLYLAMAQPRLNLDAG